MRKSSKRQFNVIVERDAVLISEANSMLAEIYADIGQTDKIAVWNVKRVMKRVKRVKP